jgi:hypothetical protein
MLRIGWAGLFRAILYPALTSLATMTTSDLKQGPAQGSHVGRDAIFAHFGEIMNASGGTFKPTPIALAATDDRVFVLQELTGTRNGVSMHQGSVMVFTLAGGLVREMREFFADQKTFEAFWA